MPILILRWHLQAIPLNRKYENRKTDQMGKEYKMRKGLKIESYDLNLKKEGTPTKDSCQLENTGNMTGQVQFFGWTY